MCARTSARTSARLARFDPGGGRFLFRALLLEEAHEQRAALGLAHALRDRAPVIEGGKLEQVQRTASVRSHLARRAASGGEGTRDCTPAAAESCGGGDTCN